MTYMYIDLQTVSGVALLLTNSFNKTEAAIFLMQA